jgi:hypothetical protein
MFRASDSEMTCSSSILLFRDSASEEAVVADAISSIYTNQSFSAHPNAHAFPAPFSAVKSDHS